MDGEQNGTVQQQTPQQQSEAQQQAQGDQAQQQAQAQNAPLQGTPAQPGAGDPGDGDGGSADLEGRIAQQDARIKELEQQVAEAARSKEAEARLTKEIEDLKTKSADEALSWKLTAAGALNVKAAKALLPDHDNDIAKLKEAEPWLFDQGKPVPTGTTGLEPAGTTGGDGDELSRWRKIAGLEQKE